MSDVFSSQALMVFAKLGFAHLFVLFIFLLDTISYNITLSDAVRPYFFVIAIYFWSIYRPSFMLPIYVFVLGILFALLLHYPIGFHSILFLLLQWVVRDQRLYFLGQPYFINWIAFGFSCFCVFFIEWAFFSLVFEGGFEFSRVLYGTAITTLVFPLISLLFSRINRILPSVSQPHFV